MIKEKPRKPRFSDEKTTKEIIADYLKTVFFTFCAAFVFTLLLSFHARSEMIKNLYADIAERAQMDVKIAKQIVAHSDLMQDLKDKKFSVCMQVGNLYETAGNFENAEFAYNLAIEKARPGVLTPYFKLAGVLISQEKFDEANQVIDSVTDVKNKNLIKSKTRIFINMGDKYYSKGKFLSAAKTYEKAKYYYDRFSKKDSVIENSIIDRIVNAYIETADIMVKSGYNSEAARFLLKAEKYTPDNYKIKYKLAIIYADLEPIKSVDYFEPLLNKMPQEINYEVYSSALLKAATILDLEGKPTKAKYCRYKIHTIDVFINQNVVYKDDLEVFLDDIKIRKILFKYRIYTKYRIKNISTKDIKNLSADFVLKKGDKPLETVSLKLVDKENILYSNGSTTDEIKISFGKNIFTRRELNDYAVYVYLYKNPKYKTLVATMDLKSHSKKKKVVKEEHFD